MEQNKNGWYDLYQEEKANYSALQAKVERYESILKKMQSLQPIWLYQGHIKSEHAEEAQALSSLASEINEALSAGEGEKENKLEDWPHVCHVCGKQDCESDHK